METDKIKMVFTYGAALLALIGGHFLLYAIFQSDPKLHGGAVIAIAGGEITGVFAFLFVKEGQAGGARSSEAAFKLGQNAQPTTETTVTPSQTTTTTAPSATTDMDLPDAG